MNGIETVSIQCPYCWEMIEVTVDCSVNQQEYVEDCEVCCQPIVINAELTANGVPEINAKREN